jgi:hypothetical protein
MGGFAVALGMVALTASSEREGEGGPSFHLVLSDGHGQLQGQSEHVATEVVEIFREIGIDVTWSKDPSLSPRTNTVTVAVLNHSSREWDIAAGAMAATLGRGSGSMGSIFLFYPDIVRAMDFRPARTSSIRDGRPPGVPWDVGIARVITHEILHYYLPDRPHDETGIFMAHQRGDLLLSPRLQISPETREALLAKVRNSVTKVVDPDAKPE